MRLFWVATLVVMAATPIALAQESPAEPVESAGIEPIEVEESYLPPLSTDWDGRHLELSFSLAERVSGVSQFPVDVAGTSFAPDAAFNTQIRIGAVFDSAMTMAPTRISLVYEHDLFTGLHAGGLDVSPEDGIGYPGTGSTSTQLRQLYVQFDQAQYLHLRGGFQTSDWGIGLIANDGARGWEPGNAQFIDPRDGDLVLRGLVATGPLTDQNLLFAVGFDSVVSDDVMLPGDTAQNLVASATLGWGTPHWIGFYGVVRWQESEAGAKLLAGAVDLAGSYTWDVGAGHSVTLEGEGVFIWGTTELAPTTDFPTHDVRQFGGALRLTADYGVVGGVLDMLYASGDANPDDGVVSAFKVDPNYSMGLLLFPAVMSAQTARAPATASNPDLIGVPAEDLERFPTRGSASNTISFFPKAIWHPVKGLTVYGGPLLALSEVPLTDPFNTRLAGGESRNALGGVPGRYLGTELDLGVRYRGIFAGTELVAGVEGGVFFPGSAFRTAEGGTMETVYGGRVMVQYRF